MRTAHGTSGYVPVVVVTLHRLVKGVAKVCFRSIVIGVTMIRVSIMVWVRVTIRVTVSAVTQQFCLIDVYDSLN